MSPDAREVNMTKEELIRELKLLRKRVTDLEGYASEHEGLQNLVEALFNSSPIGLYIVQDGCFVMVSTEFERVTGYSNGELVGNSSLTLVLQEDKDAVRENAIMVLKGKSSKGYEFRIVTKTGETRTILETIAPVRYQGKRAVLGNFMDITERKKLEEELNLRAQLLDNAGDFITLIDPGRNILYVNEAFCRAHGYSREELIGMDILRLETQGSNKTGDLVARGLREKGEVVFETTHLRKDGSTIDVEVHSRAIYSGNERLTLNIERDITESKRAEEALLQSEEKLRRMFESLSLGVSVTNLDGEITEVNEAKVRMHGYDNKDELIGRSVFEHIAEKDLDRAIEDRASVLRSGFAKSDEHTFRTKDGRSFLAKVSLAVLKDRSGNSTGLIAITEDITERKKLEEERERLIQELQETLAKINTLSGLLPICAWCKKLRDDNGYWESVEEYISGHTGAEFTHGICPDCQKKYLAEDSSGGNSKQNNNGKGS